MTVRRPSFSGSGPSGRFLVRRVRAVQLVFCFAALALCSSCSGPASLGVGVEAKNATDVTAALDAAQEALIKLQGRLTKAEAGATRAEF